MSPDESMRSMTMDVLCEACEEHVAEEMFLMLEGDDTIRAVVTPRWDTGSEEPRAL